jgi:hypothetical protein
MDHPINKQFEDDILETHPANLQGEELENAQFALQAQILDYAQTIAALHNPEEVSKYKVPEPVSKPASTVSVQDDNSPSRETTDLTNTVLEENIEELNEEHVLLEMFVDLAHFETMKRPSIRKYNRLLSQLDYLYHHTDEAERNVAIQALKNLFCIEVVGQNGDTTVRFSLVRDSTNGQLDVSEKMIIDIPTNISFARMTNRKLNSDGGLKENDILPIDAFKHAKPEKISFRCPTTFE